MLSLERFREVLGEDAPEDDNELRNLRDQLYAVGHLVVDVFLAKDGDRTGEQGGGPCE